MTEKISRSIEKRRKDKKKKKKKLTYILQGVLRSKFQLGGAAAAAASSGISRTGAAFSPRSPAPAFGKI